MAWKVTASKVGLSTTYLCATPAIALERIHYFGRKDYTTLIIIGLDGAAMTTAELDADVAASTTFQSESDSIRATELP